MVITVCKKWKNLYLNIGFCIQKAIYFFIRNIGFYMFGEICNVAGNIFSCGSFGGIDTKLYELLDFYPPTSKIIRFWSRYRLLQWCNNLYLDQNRMILLVGDWRNKKMDTATVPKTVVLRSRITWNCPVAPCCQMLFKSRRQYMVNGIATGNNFRVPDLASLCSRFEETSSVWRGRSEKGTRPCQSYQRARPGTGTSPVKSARCGT